MRPRSVHFALLLALSLVSTAVQAGNLTPYYTDDPAVKGSKPPAGWTAVSDSIQPSLNNGDKFWVSFLNDEDVGKYKFFTMKIGPANLINTNVADTDGFTGDLDTNDVPKKALNGYGISGNQFTIRYRFGKPQPRWERIGFKATADIDTVKLHMKAWSVCADAKPQWPELAVLDASFGTVTPLGEIGNPRVTAMQWFPLNYPVDEGVVPTILAPPATGTWTINYITVDQAGDPRPLGGYEFLCDGPGLSRDDEFSLTYGAEQAGEVDPEHEMFAWESQSGQWMDFTIDIGPAAPQDIPTLSEWALIVLTLGMASVAIVYMRRRRVTA